MSEEYLFVYKGEIREDVFKILCTSSEARNKSVEMSLEELKNLHSNKELGSKVTGIPQDVLERMYPNKNKQQLRARIRKDDEFYTRYCDVKSELDHYNINDFVDKIIYCPTDVAIEDGYIRKSNFVTYFQERRGIFNFKKLIATCLAEKGSEYNNKYILERKETENGIEWVETFGQCEHDFNGGYSSGDYRSEECMKLLEESDIVITNPPFSIFRDFIDWVIDAKKDMLIIGNSNAVSYNNVFHYLKNNLVRLGAKKWSGGMGFIVPKSKQDELLNKGNKTAYMKDDTTDEIYAVVSSFWYTTLRPDSREHAQVEPIKKYYGNESDYPTYDNYDAIEVSKVENIPCDYYGKIGVPVTYFDSAREDLFDVVGMSKLDANLIEVDGKRYSTVFVLNKKPIYTRVVIQRKKPKEAKYKVGTKLRFSVKGNPRDVYNGVVEKTDGEKYYISFEADGKSQKILSDFTMNVFEISDFE